MNAKILVFDGETIINLTICEGRSIIKSHLLLTCSAFRTSRVNCKDEAYFALLAADFQHRQLYVSHFTFRPRLLL